MSTAPEAISCPNCRKTFTDPQSQAQHVASAHAARTIPCTHCTRKFSTSNALHQHLTEVERYTQSAPATPAISTESVPLVDPTASPSAANGASNKNNGPKSKKKTGSAGESKKTKAVRPSSSNEAQTSSFTSHFAHAETQMYVHGRAATHSKAIDEDWRRPASTSQVPPSSGHSHANVAHSQQGKSKRGQNRAKATSSTIDDDLSNDSLTGSNPDLVAPEPVKLTSKDPNAHIVTPSKRATSSQTQTPNSTENRASTASRLARGIYGTPSSTPSHHESKSKATSTPVHFQTPNRKQQQDKKPFSRGATPAHYTNRVDRGRQVYPEYMTLEKAREEVKAGRAWEGVLRANPNASRMCFFTIPGRVKDLMVKDEWLNRAFPGDTVIIQMLTEEDQKEEAVFQERRKARRGGGGGGYGGKGHDGKGESGEKKGKGENGESKNVKNLENALVGYASSASPAKNMEPSSSPSLVAPSHGLRSEVLKGIENDQDSAPHSGDEPHDDSASDVSRDDLSDANSDSGVDEAVPRVLAKMSVISIATAPTSDSTAPSQSTNDSEAVLAQLEKEMSLLNMTTHATFSASNFNGTLEENKPKAELAKVIHITDPHHEQVGYVGQLKRRSDGGFELRPLAVQHPIFDIPNPDPEFLDDIPMVESRVNSNGRRNRKKKTENNENTKIFIVQFKRWNNASRRPLGTKPVLVGESGDVEAECRAITSTHMIDTTPHPARLSSSFGNDTTIKITEAELARRKDLRSTRIFTVDPPTARDIDDALSIEKLSETRYRVGVHIADVSLYVTPGSELDNIAKKRSTSVYMVHTMYPMLPGALSENLCSLNPKVDRFAFSVMWDLDEQGNIIGNEWIGRTIIRSCVKLSYTDAQKCIDGNETGDMQPAIEHLRSLQPEQTPESIAGDILNLNMLAQRMRDRRFAGGALRLSRLRLHFELGLDGYPVDAHPYWIKESNQLIEEFMLLANMSVAKFIHSAFPHSAILRSHPQPKDDILEAFGHLMKALNIKFDTSTSGSLYKSLMQLEGWQQRPIEELVTKAMNAAVYVSTGSIQNVEELWHYALNVPFYTHFTSPIRRYPDIVVHRQIQAALDKHAGKLFATTDDLIHADPCHDSNWVAEVADHSNERKKSARKAQDDSIKLFACLFLKRAPFVDAESIVLDVARNKISVFSPILCMRLKIDITEKKGFSIKFDSNTRVLSITDTTNNQCLISITYFSKVSVTYYTKGKMPMDTACELSLWFKPELLTSTRNGAGSNTDKESKKITIQAAPSSPADSVNPTPSSTPAL
jgi:VacB/RNase II family 3'-5' exoribonuclease